MKRNLILFSMLALVVACGKNDEVASPAQGVETEKVETLTPASAEAMAREILGEAFCSPLPSMKSAADTDLLWAVIVREGAPVPVDVVLSPNPPVGAAIIIRLYLSKDGLAAYEVPSGAQSINVRCDPPVTKERLLVLFGKISSETHPAFLQRRSQEISGLMSGLNSAFSLHYGRNGGRYPIHPAWTDYAFMPEMTPYFPRETIRVTGIRIEYTGDTESYQTRILDEKGGLVWTYSSIVGRIQVPEPASISFAWPTEDKTLIDFVEKMAQLAVNFGRLQDHQNRGFQGGYRYSLGQGQASISQTVY